MISGERELVYWYDQSDPDNIYYPGERFSLDENMCFGSFWLPATSFSGINIFNKPENNTLYIGENHRLNAIAVPMYLATKCTWEVDNENIATIDQNGVITPKAEGTVIVIIEANENGNDDVYYYDYCVLEVKKKIFSSDEKIDDGNVRMKALAKMEEYYLDTENGLKEWIDGDNTCIFAFEGLGDPSLKELDTVPTNRTNTSEIHPVWLYNAMMVVTKGRKIVYVARRASTLPDLRPGSGRATTIKNGVYEYCTGNHGWAWENGKQVIGESTYIGLVPTDDPRVAWYVRENEFVDDDSNGTNLHAGTALFHGNTVYYNSEGCQIVHFKDYISLGKAVGFLKNDSVLEDVTSAPSLGTTMHNTIGAVGGDKDYSQSVKVKYILNRDYDNQNPYKGDSIYADKNYGDNSSKYPDGVFYPL